MKANKDAEPCSYNYDISHFGGNTDYCCECVGIGNSAQSVLFSENVYFASDVWYSRISPNSANLFGCVGMRRGNYAIFNKPLAKEEFQKQKQSILNHMRETGELGEFFPVALSPFCYNESVAQDYFPLEREVVIKDGWKWREDPDEQTSTKRLLAPEAASLTDEEVLKAVFRCQTSERSYRITRQELQFYRKHSLRLPTNCPEERLLRRIRSKRPRRQLRRHCAHCAIEVQTSLSQQDCANLLCEQCFQNSVE